MRQSLVFRAMLSFTLISIITSCGAAPSRHTQGRISIMPAPKDGDAVGSTFPDWKEPPASQENGSSPPPVVPDPSTPAVDTLCYKADAFLCEIEKIIVEETNRHRSSALAQNKESCWVARQWSDAQAAKGQISHDGFPAARRAALTAEFPAAKWNFYAENVAMSQSSSLDASKIAKAFVEMWWNSAGHKENMLGNYKNIGVGVSKIGNSYYATQIFY
jgi:uncharacterized protein YkwD